MNPESEPAPSAAVSAELSALEDRLRMWKHDYLTFPAATRARDYQEEVEAVVLPYLTRLREEELISSADFARMSSFIDRQIDCLRSSNGREA